MAGIVVKKIKRPPRELVERFRNLSVSTLHEAIGKNVRNLMDPGIKPVAPEMKLVGTAVTVQCYPGDNITVHRAMALAEPGDVLVIDGGGILGVMFGAQMAYQSHRQGIAGVVVDGSVRDVAEIRRMGFPCFARVISPQGSAKENPGSINIPIKCGGVVVRPGDIIVGDDDGVVVVRPENAGEVLEKAIERERREEELRKLMDQGRTSYELYNFEKIFREKGVKEVDEL
ncbi:MAG TPA: 4-carboxy-4-hydroxy-2-oxoadipate aldolase/oxaloacetate decarboxylase [Candidatus Caldiarchaeum subterraneum]|uniref:4-carboxy-4-hydroxy-2-oxoadipate aldolase/oxaloacetate decarboxylase n=1 Tax=Caldiarchaeum subterraneum TaxID=311458 RepID=A0A833ECZ4_CALS0|nr:4-carboxy-4-hydroxy-2-oxoadipate aldolase/oxaloacetate decarboxylase [Candidatus Caldarchaeum subterraneum]